MTPDSIHFAAHIDLSEQTAATYRALCGFVSNDASLFINWKNVNAAMKKESGEWRITCEKCQQITEGKP
jgi:hypothetical protein